MMNNKTTFDSNGVSASSPYLASIAAECLAAERAALQADRRARELGASYGRIDISSDLWGDDYADHILSEL